MARRIHHSSSSSLRRQRGSIIVEFALMLPLFLTLVLGVIEGSRVIWMYNTMSHAAREGARYAVVHGADSPSPASSSDIEQVVRDRAVGVEVEVTTAWENPNKEPGSMVEVQVRSEFRSVLPMLLGVTTIPLASTSRMVIDY